MTPTFKLKLHCLEFSFKNHFLPTMTDDHTSEASEWLRREGVRKYCEYSYRQTDAIIHELHITMYDSFGFVFLSHADCANGHACFVGEVGIFCYL